jgi:hypothetical protein
LRFLTLRKYFLLEKNKNTMTVKVQKYFITAINITVFLNPVNAFRCLHLTQYTSIFNYHKIYQNFNFAFFAYLYEQKNEKNTKYHK